MLKLVVILSLIFGSLVGAAKDVDGESLITGFSSAQTALWNDYLTSQKTKVTVSQISTFAAVTHALEHTYVIRDQNALGLVSKVIGVEGDVPALPSYEQFNLAVIWKPEAIQTFEKSGFTYRIGFGHVGESGVSYHSSSYGLHVLYEKTNLTQGHVHVDYRYFSLAARGEGHFQPYNSDVRAIGPELDSSGKLIDNYLRHNQWYGAIPNFGKEFRR